MTHPVDSHRIAQLRDRLEALPRVTLASLPTPLDACPRLSADLGGVSVYVKRDDLTGLAFGGNKVRQHEYVLGAAVAAGADSLVQGSASQSNHSRQIAAAGARLGLETHLVPLRDARSHPVQGNYLVDHLLGAHLHPVELGESIIAAKQRVADELRAAGKNPYVVGMGAQEALELAAVAYVGAMCELVEQLGGAPDAIYMTSQGSTQAGLMVAAEFLGIPTRIVGIAPLDERHEAFITREGIFELVEGVVERLGLTTSLSVEDVDHRTEFVGAAYGQPSDAGLEALRLLASSEGILLDPVYTSKGFAGLLHDIRSGALTPGQSAVFLHTGGLPALFAYASELVPSADAS